MCVGGNVRHAGPSTAVMSGSRRGLSISRGGAQLPSSGRRRSIRGGDQLVSSSSRFIQLSRPEYDRGVYRLRSGNHDWGRGLVAGAKSLLALSLALPAQEGHVPIRASFFGHSRTAQGMPRCRRLRASIGSGAAVALSNGSAELEPPPVLTMMFLSEGFKSLRERILPSGAVLSRGRGALFRKADPDVATRCLDPARGHRQTARARGRSRAFAF